jgi:hypothetical protein
MTMHIIFNRLGKGKTTFLAWIGLISWLQGKVVYANFHLAIPYTYVTSAMDLRQMGRHCLCCDKLQEPREKACKSCGSEQWRDAVLLIDDAYRWFYARLGFNPLVNEVLAQSRKRGIDIFYTMVRSNQIDTNLRSCTEFCWVPVIIPQVRIMIAPRFIYYPDRGFKGGDEERIGEPLGGFMIGNLDYIWEQFDTAEEIQNLQGVELVRKK